MNRNSKHLTARGSAPGITIGTLHFVTTQSLKGKTKKLSETTRLEQTWQELANQAGDLHLSLQFKGEDARKIAQAYRLLIETPYLRNALKKILENGDLSAEKAIQKLRIDYKKKQTNPKKVSSHADLPLLILRELEKLLKKASENKQIFLPPGEILLLDHLSPHDLFQYHQSGVQGLICKEGGYTSHTLILAKALGMPTLQGISTTAIRPEKNVQAILDGYSGKLILDPGEGELKYYKQWEAKNRLLLQIWQEQTRQPAITKDGIEITIEANIDHPKGFHLWEKSGADGIGLFRTESIAWALGRIPTQKEQQDCFATWLQHMQEKPFTIRLWDTPNPLSPSPVLAERGCMALLQHPDLLEAQLKAIIHTAQIGPLRLLLPMVRSVEEVETIKAKLQTLAKKTGSQTTSIKIGVMIETPATLFLLSEMMEQADFFCIGTNDLTQQILSIDRQSGDKDTLQNSQHPAVWKALEHIRKSVPQNFPITICGEIAADPKILGRLIQTGYQRFSMTPLSIPKCKEQIRRLSFR